MPTSQSANSISDFSDSYAHFWVSDPQSAFSTSESLMPISEPTSLIYAQFSGSAMLTTKKAIPIFLTELLKWIRKLYPCHSQLCPFPCQLWPHISQLYPFICQLWPLQSLLCPFPCQLWPYIIVSYTHLSVSYDHFRVCYAHFPVSYDHIL